MASVHQEIDSSQQGDKEGQNATFSVVCEHETSTPAVAVGVMAPGSYTTKFGFDVHKIKGSLSEEVYAVAHLVQVRN